MTYVSSSKAEDGTGTVLLPSGATGDILVAFTVDLTGAPAGYTQRGNTLTVGGVTARLWTNTRASGDTAGSSHVFTGTSDFSFVHLLDLSGVNEAPTSFATIGQSGTSGAAPTGSSVSPAAAGTLVFCGDQAENALTGTPSGMTSRLDSFGAIQTWTQEISAGATGTRAFATAVAAWGVFLAAFENAGPPVGPTIDTQPSNAYKAVGDTSTFTVAASASGGGTLSYQWKLGGVNVSTGTGGTTASYTTAALALSDDAGSYTCEVTETGGSNPGAVTSSAATLRIGVLLVASSTAVYTATGTPTTIAPTWPTTAIAAGAVGKVILVVGMKPATSGAGSVTTPTAPSAWTLIGSIQAAGGYTVGGASAADTGNCDLYVYAIDDPGTVTGSITVTLSVGATNGVAWATMIRYSAPPGSTYSLALATGSDTAAGSVSIAFSTDPGVALGDRVLAAMCVPTDVTTPAQFSAQAFTQTGVTFGTVTEIQETDSGNNFDIGGFLVDALATAGPSSAAPTMTATAGGTTTNVRGPGIFLRLRAAAASGGTPGIATETETALALSAAHSAVPGVSAETDTALAIAAPLTPGVSSEADAALPLAAQHVAVVGSAATLEIAHALSSQHVAAIGLATETDTGQAVGASHVAAAGLATETDSAQALAAPGAAPGIATETDSAFGLGSAHTAVAGLATETDSAQALSAQHVAGPSLSLEADAAFGRASVHMAAPGVSGEGDTALAPSGGASAGVGIESDLALALASVHSAVVGLATEADTSVALSAQHVSSPGIATETSTALARTSAHVAVPGVANESDASLASGATTPGIAAESDAALALLASRVAVVGLTTQLNTALALGSVHAASPGVATETGAAIGLVSVHAAAPGVANETDSAIASVIGVAPGIATETGLALVLGARHAAPPGVANETTLALELVSVHVAGPGVANETDLAVPPSPVFVAAGPARIATGRPRHRTARIKP